MFSSSSPTTVSTTNNFKKCCYSWLTVQAYLLLTRHGSHGETNREALCTAENMCAERRKDVWRDAGGWRSGQALPPQTSIRRPLHRAACLTPSKARLRCLFYLWATLVQEWHDPWWRAEAEAVALPAVSSAATTSLATTTSLAEALAVAARQMAFVA